jgi:hypothetical protein
MSLREIPLDSDAWRWGDASPVAAEHLGRPCYQFGDQFALATVDGLDLADGTLELDLAVTAERSFHGVAWHVADERNYESFFVRPHQVGNPDAIQYTPVTNGISSWQLYHGPGFWAPVAFPIGDWFTVRVAVAGRRATLHVADLDGPVLVIGELKLLKRGTGVGLLVGGPGLRIGRFAWSDEVPNLPGPMAPPAPPYPGVISSWLVSETFEEEAIASALEREHRWTRLNAESTGLLDLARAGGIEGDRNTVLARAALDAKRDEVKLLGVGYSDRAVVFLNGVPLYRGDATYRLRDYRFLGSIGYWDGVYLPLRQGRNELVVAVSETFGGWGVQARLADPEGVTVLAG